MIIPVLDFGAAALVFGAFGDASLYEMQMGVRAVLLVILSSALAVLTFVAVFRRRKKLTRAQLAMFVLSLFSSRSAVILIMEFLLGCDLISRYLAQQEENERQRTRLAVAQACNEGRLFVEFDTPATRFRLPALTLQPIVENAAPEPNPSSVAGRRKAL